LLFTLLYIPLLEEFASIVKKKSYMTSEKWVKVGKRRKMNEWIEYCWGENEREKWRRKSTDDFPYSPISRGGRYSSSISFYT
jgi:hypothetical protein